MDRYGTLHRRASTLISRGRIVPQSVAHDDVQRRGLRRGRARRRGRPELSAHRLVLESVSARLHSKRLRRCGTAARRRLGFCMARGLRIRASTRSTAEPAASLFARRPLLLDYRAGAQRAAAPRRGELARAAADVDLARSRFRDHSVRHAVRILSRSVDARSSALADHASKRTVYALGIPLLSPSA